MQSGEAKVCPQCGEIKNLSDFKDGSLVTGIGRLCYGCKSVKAYGRRLSSGYFVYSCSECQSEYKVDTLTGRVLSNCSCLKYQKSIIPNQSLTISSSEELTKRDINKLLSFSENPEKYATGTIRAKEKVLYLDSIKHKLSEGQMATYITAREKYDAVLIKRVDTKKNSKVDYTPILFEALNNHRSVKIRYKGSWRKINPYSLDKTYVVAFCNLARAIRTFRIDRIQEAELSESFNFDNTLLTTTQNKLSNAPEYRGGQWYRNKY